MEGCRVNSPWISFTPLRALEMALLILGFCADSSSSGGAPRGVGDGATEGGRGGTIPRVIFLGASGFCLSGAGAVGCLVLAALGVKPLFAFCCGITPYKTDRTLDTGISDNRVMR